MKSLTALFVVGLAVSPVHARELGADEALKLRDAGTIQSFETLNAKALEHHPGGAVSETELEQSYGKYLYKIELRDADGVEWDLELDAVSGQVLKNHQDV